MIDNKLVPINELVKSYENYLNSLPVFTTTNATTQVVKASINNKKIKQNELSLLMKVC